METARNSKTCELSIFVTALSSLNLSALFQKYEPVNQALVLKVHVRCLSNA